MTTKMDIVELVERDHREVEELFAKFASTGDAELVDAICDALDRHRLAELRVLYPVVDAELPNGRQMAGESEDEHAEVARLIDRIRDERGTDCRAALVGELEVLVEEHVDAEETEVLPQVRVMLESPRRADLGRAFAAVVPV
ncbi:MAG TPA: hemerythrin domain-containing protein [Acidimicrobiia bacterium]|jgi:hemerythrin superfamily protein